MKPPKTAVIRTQGNVASMSNSLEDLGVPYSVLSPGEEWESFNRVIMPGVGNILAYASLLNKHNFSERVYAYLKGTGNRVLGVCVGFQYLSLGSEESSAAECLGLFPITFSKFSGNKLIRIPHVGWNTLEYSDGVLKEQYFTHSYAAFVPQYGNNLALAEATEFAKSFHGEQFISFYRKDNIYGIQSHPEKSRQDGLEFISKFINI